MSSMLSRPPPPPPPPHSSSMLSRLRDFSNSALAEFKKAQTEHLDGWEVLACEESVNHFQKRSSFSNDAFFSRSVNWENVSAHKCFVEVTKPSNKPDNTTSDKRGFYDNDISEPRVVWQKENMSIVHYKWPAFDVVALVAEFEPTDLKTTSYFVVARSILPEQFGLEAVCPIKGIVRANLRAMGWRFESGSNGKSCKITHLMSLDPRIKIVTPILQAQIVQLRQQLKHWQEPDTLASYVYDRAWCAVNLNRDLISQCLEAFPAFESLADHEELLYYYYNNYKDYPGNLNDAIIVTTHRIMRIRSEPTLVEQVCFHLVENVAPITLVYLSFSSITFSLRGGSQAAIDVWNHGPAVFLRDEVWRLVAIANYNRAYPAHIPGMGAVCLSSRILHKTLSVDHLAESKDTELQRMLPLLLCFLKTGRDIQSISEALFARCESAKFRSHLLYLLHALRPSSTSFLFERLAGSLAARLAANLAYPKHAKAIVTTENWFEALRQKDQSEMSTYKADVRECGLLNPLNAGKDVIGVRVEKVFDSGSKPLLLELSLSAEEKEWIIFKPDPVIKDCLALCVLSVFNDMWAEENKPYFAVLYNVLPQRNFGLIECLSGVESVQVWDEDEKWHSISELNQADRERFLHSAVGGFIAAHLLGVRDRHKDNMLIRNGQELVMIDFEYLFGMGFLFDAPSIAISAPMVQWIRGLGDQYWCNFEAECCSAFLILRAKKSHVMTMVCQLFADTGVYTREVITAHMQTAFYSNLSNKEAEQKLKEELNASWCPLWWTKDYLHTVRHRN